MRLFATALFVSSTVAFAAPEVTFHKNVERILQNHCQECHRPGEIAPFSLLTYEQARPYAKAIKADVLQGKMPPWPADPHFGKFSNDRSLSKADIDTIVAWVDGGALQGNKADAPKPRTFVDGWNISKPDHVFEMPNASRSRSWKPPDRKPWPALAYTIASSLNLYLSTRRGTVASLFIVPWSGDGTPNEMMAWSVSRSSW